jgi:hypothetical protein
VRFLRRRGVAAWSELGTPHLHRGDVAGRLAQGVQCRGLVGPFLAGQKTALFSPLFALLSICHVLKMIALPRQARDKHIEGNALNKREAVFSQPTVEGVDFPTLGISAARNDLSTGELLVKTYAAAPSCAGQATSFKLTTLDGCDLASLTQGGR